MRLYKAKNLQEYVEQLERDVIALNKYLNEFKVNNNLSGNFNYDRDVEENHSYIIGVHKDLLRQERNAKRNSGV